MSAELRELFELMTRTVDLVSRDQVAVRRNLAAAVVASWCMSLGLKQRTIVECFDLNVLKSSGSNDRGAV